MTAPFIDLGQTEFAALLETMRLLRDPQDGCPWDVEQTHQSLQHTMLEESYEAMEAIGFGSVPDMVEELGDLLIQVVFHAQIGVDNGTFAIADVVRYANEKLVRRHPHVFGDAQAATAEDVKHQWDQIKAVERREKGQDQRSILDGVPRTMPALAYGQATQERVARAGFDPLQHGLAQIGVTQKEQLGGALFALVEAARTAGVEAEEALRSANQGFYQRFTRVEELCRQQGLSLTELNPAQRAALWAEAAFGG